MGKEQTRWITAGEVETRKVQWDLRKYPAFRDGFKRNIEPMCQSSQRAFVLRVHLGDMVMEEVANIEDVPGWK